MPSPADFAGLVSGCTVEDRPALWDLCRAAEPDATILGIGGSLRQSDFSQWAVYRDKNRQIRVAVFVMPNWGFYLVVNPDDANDPEVKQGFLDLAREVCRVNGLSDPMIMCAKPLERFAELLTAEGFLSDRLYSVHMMHFTPTGEAERGN